MKIRKSLLRTIIKEEIGRSLLNEAEEQVYGFVDGKKFKLVDQGNKFLLISCGGASCMMLGSMPKMKFKNKLKQGEFKAL
jgi:hypothetical protein